MGGGERRAGGKEVKSFLPLAMALDARETGCFPGLAGLLSASKGMLGPWETSVTGSGSHWGSRELVEKAEGDLVSGLSYVCL